jgi:LysM repeat protein
MTSPATRPGDGALKTTSRVLEPTYTVKPGDTLNAIATRHGTTVDALQSINNLPDRNVLSVGQKLVIPNQE